MKTIKFTLSAVLLFLMVATMAQTIDATRMERDIEVAENILATLLKERNGGFLLESINGTFIDDYGVILSLPHHRLNGSFSYTTTARAASGGGNKEVIILDSNDESVVAVNVPAAEVKKINKDSIENLQKEKTIDAMKLFLVDYGTLISQLKPDHKILITNRDNNFQWMRNRSGMSELSAEATIQDLNDYKTGKISRDILMEKIKVINRSVEEERSTDLELLSSIMGRLYQSDLSNTYYTSSNPQYDRLSEFGVIYHMKMYSSSENNGKHRIHTRNATDLTREERDAIVKEMYPQFLNSLKENILDYGKTVSSLKDDEILMFQVGLTKCAGCNIPKELKVSVKSNVLQKYSQGKISRVQALKEFKISEGEMQ